jgi:uncharacterized glyoxalase superfamily protein PhnB
MLTNRSMPRCVVIPELAYPDVARAADWLCKAFGFSVRLRIANHRVQLNAGSCAIVVTARGGDPSAPLDAAHSVMLRVEDVDRQLERAAQEGAELLRPAADYPYGERQGTVRDIGGHVWTLSQSIADVDPTTWGGTPGQP